jgi:hypothetical protein
MLGLRIVVLTVRGRRNILGWSLKFAKAAQPFLPKKLLTARHAIQAMNLLAYVASFSLLFLLFLSFFLLFVTNLRLGKMRDLPRGRSGS